MTILHKCNCPQNVSYVKLFQFLYSNKIGRHNFKLSLYHFIMYEQLLLYSYCYLSVRTSLQHVFACYESNSSEVKCSLTQSAWYCGQLLQLRMLDDGELEGCLSDPLKCFEVPSLPVCPSPSCNMVCKDGVQDTAHWPKTLLLSTACHKRKSEQCLHCVLACVSYQMWNTQKFLLEIGSWQTIPYCGTRTTHFPPLCLSAIEFPNSLKISVYHDNGSGG